MSITEFSTSFELRPDTLDHPIHCNYTLYIDVVIIDTKSVSAVFNRDN